MPFWEARERLRAESPYRSLSWRCVGPSVMSARIIDVEVSPADKHTIYLAGATSGIWKTVNSGITWNPIFDDQPDYSIGDVAIAPTDPDIIWVGTGEANFRQNVDSGFGIYKLDRLAARARYRDPGLLDVVSAVEAAPQEAADSESRKQSTNPPDDR